ncbi:MAG: DUF5719 family protein [Actinomycetota bacterium]
MRFRIAVALSLAVLLSAGLVALDRLVGPAEPAEGATSSGAEPPATADLSGSWFCPHGGGEGWRAWIAVANPSDRTAALRVSTVGVAGGRVETPAEVAPETVAYVEVPADRAPAASTVEFFGAPIGAGMVITLPDRAGVAADPCAAAASREWLIPGGTTIRGQRARLVIMNPFSTAATVDVSLAAARRLVRPGALRGLVLPPRRSASIDLNRFALGEGAVAASVRATLGRVVAGAVGISTEGVRAAIGVPAPARAWVLPGIADDGMTDLQVFVPGREEAPFRVRAQRVDGQGPVLDEASVAGGFAEKFELEVDQAGLVVEAAGAKPFVASRRTGSTDAGDGALTAGAVPSATRWLALPASRPGGAGARLLLVNPGGRTARARVTLLSDTGPVDAPSLQDVTLEPGRILVVDLSSIAGLRPVAAVVEVMDGTLVPAQESISSEGYAVSAGIPLPGLLSR